MITFPEVYVHSYDRKLFVISMTRLLFSEVYYNNNE
jgi:hypothetical protein